MEVRETIWKKRFAKECWRVKKWPKEGPFPQRQVEKYASPHQFKYLILLSGDIQLNAGPTRKEKDPCSICSKGCRRKAILCDCCDSWYHTKCIGMSNVEYEELGKPSARWDCISCLFPIHWKND